MQGDFAEVGTSDFSEICLRVSVAGEARAKIHFSVTHILVAPAPPSVESKLKIFAAQQEINC